MNSRAAYRCVLGDRNQAVVMEPINVNNVENLEVIQWRKNRKLLS